jgi:hypothetical protein
MALICCDVSDKAGDGYTLLFTSTLKPLFSTAPLLVESVPLRIIVGPAAQLLLKIQPQGGAAGDGLLTQPMAVVADVGGNIVQMSYLNPRHNVSVSLLATSGWHTDQSSGTDDR